MRTQFVLAGIVVTLAGLLTPASAWSADDASQKAEAQLRAQAAQLGVDASQMKAPEPVNAPVEDFIKQDAPPQDGVEALKSKLVFQGSKYAQILILVNSSTGMYSALPALEDLGDRRMDIRDHIVKQIQEGGRFSIGVRVYGDSMRCSWSPCEPFSRVEKPLASQKELDIQAGRKYHPCCEKWHITDAENEVEGLQASLTHAMHDIDSLQMAKSPPNHWKEAVKAIKEEPWSSSPDTERVILLLTSEEAEGVGIGAEDYAKAVALAKTKGIRFERVYLPHCKPTYLGRSSLRKYRCLGGGLHRVLFDEERDPWDFPGHWQTENEGENQGTRWVPDSLDD